ncbi:MAG: pyridine nucleotide-disulfide oxidoreductase [Lentisphaerae bacterium RIFOXYA12_FULL_48_11]|nr:MAG: pyridine nucleotide-disulfide oxidoreductase [Lentisphaerae bacterium RIFOXYA12_FULL_48_11]
MKIVVIGGVAGGASAAARARRLNENAEIIILERGKNVSFANCGLPYHIGGIIKDRESLLLQTPQSLKESLNLDVRVEQEVINIDRTKHTVTVKELQTGREYTETYNKLVLCPGASPIKPPLPGIDHPSIYVLRNIDDMDQIKAKIDAGAKRAIVIGGGYIGVEMAENLRERGLEVDLVEMVDQLMPPLDREMARDLENHMIRHGIRLHLGTAAAAFRSAANLISIELTNGDVLKADLVIMSVGVRPETDLAKKAGIELGQRGGIKVNNRMQTSDPDIYAAGDVIEVTDTVTGTPAIIPLAGPANRQGRVVADNLMGISSKYTSTQGTAIVKVFDMTGGVTGATEKTLIKAKRKFGKIYIHPSGHAGYYPGTSPMSIKVTFDPDTEKVLGAQVVGFDGVDKRLDVFATAIRAGMTIYDLKDLELSYAPPYGSAKDPVNMAGFVAENLLKGNIEFWYSEDYPKKTANGLIMDVRGPQEFESWHIPGAVNIPLGKLRKQIKEIPTDKPIYVYCKVGFRSYLAYRILKQSGINRVSTLAGGSLTFCSYHPNSVTGQQPEPPTLAYAEEKMAAKPEYIGKTITVDCCGLQCPGPIKKLKDTLDSASVGDEIVVYATDPGFAADSAAWCRKNGHTLLDIRYAGPKAEAHIRKGNPTAQNLQGTQDKNDKLSMVVFSGDLDKVLAAFVIANGAIAMGSKVTMFFTFWGLNTLRNPGPQAEGKSMIDSMFGWMMPAGPEEMKLSNMNMLGAGTAMMKHVMQNKNVSSLPELLGAAIKGGAKLVACTMSMDVMGIKEEELIDGVEFGGVATFLEESSQSGTTLFI